MSDADNAERSGLFLAEAFSKWHHAGYLKPQEPVVFSRNGLFVA
jgi:hypothetical protein